MLVRYLQKFSTLRTDKGRNRYPTTTNHRAPHKPLLLLSVMDLLAQGAIKDNFIEPSFDLADTWNGYWNAIMPIGRQSTMAYPFERLKSDGFWHLVANPGYETKRPYNASSVTALQRYYAGAQFDDELFALLCIKKSREQLRAVLIETYFTKEIRPVLIEQGVVNLQSDRYGKKLLRVAEQQAPFGEKLKKESRDKVRDQGFRKVIVTLYEHRCSLCGLRMITPEGYTAVDASHIKPWSESHDDRPTNGMALCKLCHWSFDKGLMSIGKDYEVLISRSVRTEKNILGHTLTLMDRPIFKPRKEKFWPTQDNLTWHRKQVFLK
ncbi:HNH endonuclease [Thermodesulfobacteriota bacterium]